VQLGAADVCGIAAVGSVKLAAWYSNLLYSNLIGLFFLLTLSVWSVSKKNVAIASRDGCRAWIVISRNDTFLVITFFFHRNARAHRVRLMLGRAVQSYARSESTVFLRVNIMCC